MLSGLSVFLKIIKLYAVKHMTWLYKKEVLIMTKKLKV